MQKLKSHFLWNYTQTDLTRENDRNGIQKFMKILNEIPSFTTVEFEIDDIVVTS